VATDTFKSWWEATSARLADYADDREAARHIRQRLNGLAEEQQHAHFSALLAELLGRRHDYGVALFLLEGVSEPAWLDDFARHLLPLPAEVSHDQESHLADLVRVLAAAGSDELIAPIRAYLLDRPIGSHWSTVPWALWPAHKELFGRAWRRFFIQHEPTDWKNTLVIKSFLAEPDAIDKVRETLEIDCAEVWVALRAALLRQAGLASWLSEEHRAALDRALL